MQRLVAAFSTLAALLTPSLALAGALVEVPVPNLGSACDDMDKAPLVAALEREAATMLKMKGGITIGDKSITYVEYSQKTLTPLAALLRSGAPDMCSTLASRFTFYRNPDAGPGKFTVYQNPLVKASRTMTGAYKFPLYKRPAAPLDALTTAEIFAGGLAGKGLEFIYLADPTEANLIHVEGSATVSLDDGTSINIVSDGHNGQAYQNVGKLLAADNKIPKDQVTPIGMTRARKYFQDHPADLWVYWGKNPHFVFFKEKKGGGGAATGKFGELTAGRSLAVDPAFVPLGAAVWFRTEGPYIANNKVEKWVSYGRLGLGQDTGSGIKGAGRCDVFYGSGDYAMAAAAVTTRPGEIYVLLAK